MRRITNIESRVKDNLGRVICHERSKKGISQDSLSDNIGVTRTFLSLVENGKRFPSYETLEKLGTALDMSIYDLLLESELDKHDEDFELVHLLTELVNSKDPDKLESLMEFAKTLR